MKKQRVAARALLISFLLVCCFASQTTAAFVLSAALSVDSLNCIEHSLHTPRLNSADWQVLLAALSS
jgi:hypothetical protein